MAKPKRSKEPAVAKQAANGPEPAKASLARKDEKDPLEQIASSPAVAEAVKRIPRLPANGLRLRIGQHIGNVLFIAIVFIIFARFLGFFLGLPTPFSVIASGSMKPTLDRGDVVLWSPVRIEDVSLEDIVVYKSTIQPDLIVVHRVKEIGEVGGNVKLTTQGDNNPFPDQVGVGALPEDYVTARNLLGRVFSAGGQPVKVPVVGHVWLMLQEGILSSPAGPAAVPIGMALLAMLVAAWTVTDTTKPNRRERIMHLILGRERIRWILTFLLLLSLLALAIGWPATVGRQEYTVSIGVGTVGTDAAISVPYATSLSKLDASLLIQNPGLTSIKAYLTVGGQAAKFVNFTSLVVSIPPVVGLNLSVPIIVPRSTPDGVYNGVIFLTGSPYWALLPDGAVGAAAAWWGNSAVFFINLLVALVISTLLVGSYILVMWAWDKYEPRLHERRLAQTRRPPTRQLLIAFASKELRERLRRGLAWSTAWAKDVHLVNVRPAAPFISGITVATLLIYVAIKGQLILAVFVAAPIAGVLCYAFGVRINRQCYRGEVMIAGLASAAILIMVTVMFPLIVSLVAGIRADGAWFAMATQTAGLALVVYALLAIPVAFLAYAAPRALHDLREGMDPGVRIREFSDL